jgi:hypothetical protein
MNVAFLSMNAKARPTDPMLAPANHQRTRSEKINFILISTRIYQQGLFITKDYYIYHQQGFAKSTQRVPPP